MIDAIVTSPDAKKAEDITHVQALNASTQQTVAAVSSTSASSAQGARSPTTSSAQLGLVQLQNSAPPSLGGVSLSKISSPIVPQVMESEDAAKQGKWPESPDSSKLVKTGSDQEAADGGGKPLQSEGLARIVKMVATPVRSKPSKALQTSKFLKLFAPSAMVGGTYT